MQQGNNTNSRPFPPFGAILNQAIKSNVTPTYSIYVFCGKDAWYQAKQMNMQMQIALCIPPDKQIDDFQWPVKGLSLILFNTGNMTDAALRAASHSLLKAGAKQVFIFGGEETSAEIYHHQPI